MRMPRQIKSIGTNKRRAARQKSKIMAMSKQQYLITKGHMHRVGNESNPKVNFGSLPRKQIPSKNTKIGQIGAKIANNSVAKGASKSNHLPTSKGTKQPTTSCFGKRSTLAETRLALSRSSDNGKDASQPTQLKAMVGLVPKTTDRLGHYSDSSSRLKKPASSDNEEAITNAKYSTTKLEFSEAIHMVLKDSCTTEGNERRDEIAVDKENVKPFGEYHKAGDSTKEKHTLDSILSDIHCNSGSISSYSFDKDPSKFQRDKALLLDDNHSIFKNVEKRESIEINMGQFANCMSKKRKEPLFEENPKALDDDSNVGVQVDNMSCKQLKKLKQSRVTRKDEAEESGGNFNLVGVEDDTASISKNDHAKVSMPSFVERQCYSCSKPIDKPTWSGIFKTDDKKYVSLDGHLSTKSCEKAWNLSRQLIKVVEVTKLSRLDVWPKAWKVSTPTSKNIGIYFFPHEMRQDRGLDQLVREVIENDLALRAIIGEVEMLIFPSILLPKHHQTFQRKHYLWGVFKRRDKGVVVEEPPSAMGHCEKEKQQKVVSDQLNHMLLVEKPNQEMGPVASTIPLERHMLSANKRTQEVEASHLKGPTNNEGFDLKDLGEEGGHAEGALVATDVTSFPASHGHIHSSIPGRLMGFVVRKTPKLDRIIQEIEREGALVFAMQGEMVGAGSWAVSKGTATEK